ncbi:hypothetical protein KBZ21_40620, partial [Streptomyces sp. A73]|nr:hypothetical protein [Streptomyces sp. A73]
CGASSAHPLALEAGQTLEVAMGTHGPIPKRSEERRRRNKDEGNEWGVPAGQPLGVQHPAAWVQIAAVSQDQTRNTMTLFPS